MALLLDAHPSQQMPMLLFAAVHAEVLARGIAYPQDGAAFIIAFCRENAEILRPTLRARSTQTQRGRALRLPASVPRGGGGRAGRLP